MSTPVAVRWESPPDAVVSGSKPAPHRDGLQVRLASLVEEMRARPATWCRVLIGASGSTNRATQIMRAGGYGFAPTEQWQIVRGLLDSDNPDVFGVWARHLPPSLPGYAPSPPPAPAVPPKPSLPPSPTSPLVAGSSAITRVPAAADLQLLCDCLHVRRLHPDDRGTYRGLCRRTGCECGGYAPKARTS